MSIRELKDFSWKRRFRFEFVVELNSSSAERLTLLAKAATTPSVTFDVLELYKQTEKIYYPQRATWNTIDVTFYDVSDGGTGIGSQSVYDWLKLYYSNPQRGRYERPVRGSQGVKKKCFLRSLSGCGGVIDEWTLEGAFPESISFGDYSADDNSVQEVTVTIKYDRAFFGSPNTGTASG